MSFPFNSGQGPILVSAELEGPAGRLQLALALDTGATRTVISTGLLIAAGHDPAQAPAQAQIITGSGVETVPLLPINRLLALGQERRGFLVFAHILPASATIDGLLGLDFLRGHILTIDFRSGQLTLS